MKILVGAGVGAIIGFILGCAVVAANWQYAGKQRQRTQVPLQAVIGGAVLGALIGAVL